MSNSDVVIKLALENKSLSKQLSDTERKYRSAMKRMERDTEGFSGSFAKSMRGLAIGATAAAGIIALGRAIKGAVDAADEMGKVAQRVGVTTEALSGLEFAASQAGVEFEVLQKALAKIAVDMSGGNSIFGKLGIEAKTADEAMVKLADRFAAMPDGIQKTALAVKVFGERAGPGLIPLLNQGSKGITDMTDRAKELGIVISDKMARDAEQFNDTMDQVRRSMQGVFMVMANELMPEMQGMANWMANPAHRKNITDVATAIATVGAASIQAAAGIADFMRWAGEATAAKIHGVSLDDTVRLNEELGKTKRRLEELTGMRPVPVLRMTTADIRGSDANKRAIEKETAAYTRLRDAIAANEAAAAARARSAQQAPKTAVAPSVAMDFGDILNPAKAGKAARASAQAVRDTYMEEMASIGKRISEALFDQTTFGLSESAVKMLELQRDRMLDLEEVAAKYSGERRANLEAELNRLHDITAATYQLEEAERRRAEYQRAGDEAYREHMAFKADQDAEELARLNALGDRMNTLFGAMAQGSDAVKDAVKALAAELLSAMVYAKILMAMGKGGSSFGDTLGGIFSGSLGKSATAPTIRIQNFGGGAVQARQRSNGDVDIMVNAIAGKIAAGGSVLDKAVSHAYGLSRRGT